MRKLGTSALAAVFALALGGAAWADDVIRIGMIRDVRPEKPPGYPYQPVEMIQERVNAGGGLRVGGRTWRLELVVRGWEYRYVDLEWNTRNATETTTRLIREDKVFAVLGPAAIPECVVVADICNTYEILNLNYWATEIGITTDRPWVFTVRSTSEEQMGAMARFAKEDLKAGTVAIIYAIDAIRQRESASAFRRAFEKISGKGAVVAWEAATDQDIVDGKLTSQLRNMVDSRADALLIVPSADKALGVVRQVRALGYKGPILSGYEWRDSMLNDLAMGLEKRSNMWNQLRGCHTFAADFDPSLATGTARDFVMAFEERYGASPDARQALTSDGLNLLLQAIRNTGGLTGDTKKDQKAVRDQLARIQGFPGITGTISYSEPGEKPGKCVSVLKILGEKDGRADFELVRTVCP